MSADLSATGTWTDLSAVFDATRSKMIGNEPRLEGQKGDNTPGGLGINFETLKTMEGVEFPELDGFINLVAVQYGVLYWQAALLVYLFVKTKFQTKSDTVLGDSNGSRLYIP